MRIPTLLPAGTWVINGRWYGVCPDCGSTVRLNKPVIGSLHFCGEWPEDEA